MSKKIIAILTIATVLFVCVFAACEKKEDLYEDAEKFVFVTDENGEKVLAEDGRFLVYETDRNGEYVTDESGEKVTSVQQFEPIMENGVYEDYGFKLKLPEGWEVSEEAGNVFVNDAKDLTIEIRLVEKLYEEYYNSAESFYGELFANGIEGSIKEEPGLIKGAEKAFQLIVNAQDEAYISIVALNFGNLYNITLKAPEGKAKVEDMNEFLSGIEFKQFTYYPELTAESTEESTEETTK